MRAPVVIASAVVVCAAAGAWWFFGSTPPPAPVVKGKASSAAPAAKARAAPAPVTSSKSNDADDVPRPRDRREAPAPAPAPPVVAAPRVATLRVETDVPGASVLIDRLGVGEAPITIPNLTPGSHRVHVVAYGYEGYAETLELEPGTRTLSIKFKEIKLDENIEVIHKHAMGSCRGRLSASPQEFRYTPTSGDHGFSVALPGVDRLETDYLKAMLSLNAQGKTFNFTAADGNAERLLIFQTNVSKARTRVLSESPR
jgi:hypothetical protein